MTSVASTTESRRRPGHSWASPMFVISGLVLLAAALGLRPVLRPIAESYRKESIALRCPLDQFDTSKLASFDRGTGRSAPTLHARDLGTDQHLYIDFVERGATDEKPIVWLFVTYYSNPGDKVPHTPEVCARQYGIAVTGIDEITIETPELGPDWPEVEAWYLSLSRPPEDDRGVTAYLFCANGKFCRDREQVRWITSVPGTRYVYFSKIEAVASVPPGTSEQVVLARCKKLLAEALPVLASEHYPDSNLFKRR